MWTATYRSLLSHKLRLALTALAVVLGVGFITGTLMIGDALRGTFRDIITNTAGGIDVTVRGHAAFENEFGMEADRGPVPAGLLPVVSEVEGVRLVEATVAGYAQLVDRDGAPIGGMGPPTLGYNAPSMEGIAGVTLRDGRFPSSGEEIAVDAFTADEHGFGVGERVTVLTQGPAHEATVVGVVTFGEARNLAGATVTLFDLDTAVERLSPDGMYTSIDVLAAEGSAPDELAERIAASVGPGYDVVTADRLVEEQLVQVDSLLGIFTTALLVFAAVSLFVGAFIIFNTFSIIVAQRTRELALLRAVGASRRQILGSVLGEAGATGLVGALLGLGFGALVAVGLASFMQAVGMEIPVAGIVMTWQTAAVGVVAGVAVTLAAAVIPAARSTTVLPVAALQEVAAPPQPRLGRVRYLLGAVVTAGGVAILAAGLFADAGMPAVLAGTAVVFLGAAMLSPLAVRPVIRVLGVGVRTAGKVQGELAQANAMRNPRRTASTAAALMVGVGLVGFVTIFAASMRASVSASLDEIFAADFQLRSATFTTALSPDVADRVAALPEVEVVGPQQLVPIQIDGGQTFAVAMEPGTIERLMPVPMVEGSAAALADGGLLVSERAARRHGWAVGDEVPVEFALTGTVPLTLRGIFDGGAIDVAYVLDPATYAENVRQRQDFAVLIGLADGVSPEAGRAAITAALADFPTANLTDRQGFKDEIAAQINQMLALVYGLLFLSVIISLVGIVNTLALSVYERVREIGLLRAVGMTRRQVRSMIRWESVLIAVLGTVLGLGLGVFFAWILIQALSDQGFSRFAVPGAQIAAAVVAAGLAGVLAAVLPARRAARVDVLRAVTVE